MSKLSQVPYQQAIEDWNNFLSNYSGIAPFSFNPSLFKFYQIHFNWKPYYIMVFRNNRLCGVLPLINTTKAWVSIPHFSYGGFLSDGTYDLDYKTLCEGAISGLDTKEPGFYRYDDGNPVFQNNEKIFIRSLSNKGGVLKSEKETSFIYLPENLGEFNLMLNSNLRRKINKAENSGIVIKYGGYDLLPDFYNVYASNISTLGSLNYGFSYFEDLITAWEMGICNVFVVYDNNIPVGSAILMGHKGFYENTYFATLKGERKKYISDFLHWKMIEFVYSQERISKDVIYSFGRSTSGSGVYKYKNHWPVENHDLYLYTNYPDIRSKGWLYNIWGILPKFITKPLGASLIRHLY